MNGRGASASAEGTPLHVDSHLQMSVPGPMTAQPEDYVLVFIFSHSTENFFDSRHRISRFLLKKFRGRFQNII